MSVQPDNRVTNKNVVPLTRVRFGRNRSGIFESTQDFLYIEPGNTVNDWRVTWFLPGLHWFNFWHPPEKFYR